VYRDPKTGKLVIAEAKGGSSQLGQRRSLDGKTMAQQGTPEYLQAVIKSLKTSDPKLAKQLTEAIQTGNLDYVKVQQSFDSSGRPEPITATEFDIDP